MILLAGRFEQEPRTGPNSQSIITTATYDGADKLEVVNPRGVRTVSSLKDVAEAGHEPTLGFGRIHIPTLRTPDATTPAYWRFTGGSHVRICNQKGLKATET